MLPCNHPILAWWVKLGWNEYYKFFSVHLHLFIKRKKSLDFVPLHYLPKLVLDHVRNFANYLERYFCHDILNKTVMPNATHNIHIYSFGTYQRQRDMRMNRMIWAIMPDSYQNHGRLFTFIFSDFQGIASNRYPVGCCFLRGNCKVYPIVNAMRNDLVCSHIKWISDRGHFNINIFGNSSRYWNIFFFLIFLHKYNN